MRLGEVCIIRDVRILIGALYELHHLHDGKPFLLACGAVSRELGRHGIERDKMWIYRRLKTLTAESVIECSDPGQSARYRWTWVSRATDSDGMEWLDDN